jgi:hypothetical protein
VRRRLFVAADIGHAPPAPQRIAALTLDESFTERTGARYVALERFALEASDV